MLGATLCNIFGFQPIPNKTGANPQEAVQMVTQRALEALSDNKENFVLPLINLKQLRGKTLSILWQEIARHTMTTCRCKFGNSNMRQMRDFPKDKGNCDGDFLRKQIKLLKISEKFW